MFCSTERKSISVVPLIMFLAALLGDQCSVKQQVQLRGEWSVHMEQKVFKRSPREIRQNHVLGAGVYSIQQP
jgi:hypothetical protein